MLAVPEGEGEAQAIRSEAESLSGRIGKNSVTVETENGFKRVDRVGKDHNGLETPHVHEYEHHTNPLTGKTNFEKLEARAATRKDVADAVRAATQ